MLLPPMTMSDDEIAGFMRLALVAATESPDPSTQNGVALVTANLMPAVTAFNNFPKGVQHFERRWVEKELKYQIVEHAERNAIYTCAAHGIQTFGSTMVAVWASCSDCARAIIQAGVGTLIRYESPESEGWKDSIAMGDMMMLEAGVIIRDWRPRQPLGYTLRRHGEDLHF